MGRKAFYFDMTHCIGCKACQAACKDRNNLPLGILYRQVRHFEVGTFPEVTPYNYISTCNHCAGAKCVKGCPTGAMFFDEGTVQHDANRCVGCQYCVWNCPYGVPRFNHDKGVVGKCDMCKSWWTDAGYKAPVCVEACNMRVLDWGEYSELEGKYPNAVHDIAVLPDSSVCDPSLFINAKKAALQKDYKLTIL